MRRRSVGGVRAWYGGLADRDKRALALGGLIVLPVLIWLGVARPYLNSLQDLRDQTASERLLLEREQQILADSAGYTLELTAAAKALAHWEGRLIRSPNSALAEAEVSAVLESIGRQSRVLLQEVRSIPAPPGAPQAPEGFQTLRMSVSGEGDFEGVLSFLRGIESERMLLQIIGVSVDRLGSQSSGSGGRSGPAALSFVVIVDVYAPADLEPTRQTTDPF